MRRSGALVLLALAPSACNLTAGGGTGDPPTEPLADVRGSGRQISEVVGPADAWHQPGNIESAGCSFPSDRNVRLTGQVIAAIDRFDETGDGATGNVYVQDLGVDAGDPVPYSGITVFDPAFTPPDLRVQEGDAVDTLGILIEFPGPQGALFGDCMSLPEIGGTMTFRFDGFAPSPTTIVQAGGTGRWDPVIGYPNARQWIGMLVRFEDVVLAEDGTEDGNGRMAIAIDMGGGISGSEVISISNELFDLQESGLDLATGAQYTAVTGVMTYFFGFKLAPRSAADFEM
jgi:hypothetical protein